MPGIILAANTGNPGLFLRVAQGLGPNVAEGMQSDVLHRFRDGMCLFQYGRKVSGRHVVILATTRSYDEWEQVYQMIHAARNARARVITVIFTYHEGRADRKDKPRVAITVQMHMEILLALGVHNVVILDPHNVAAVQNAFHGPCDVIYARPLIVEYFRRRQELLSYPGKRGPRLPVIYSTDAGGTSLAGSYADRLRWQRGFGFKVRRIANDVERVVNVGPAQGRACAFVDDLADTMKTGTEQARVSKLRGAKWVIFSAVHAVLTEGSVERLGNSAVDEIVFTNSLPIRQSAIEFWESKGKIVTIIDLRDLLVKTVRETKGTGSLSSLL